jgi:hypothetical protein
MIERQNARPAPPLVFTVAITGHQDIAAPDHGALQDKVGAILTALEGALTTAQKGSSVDEHRERNLRFLSALAPGADQIGANAALVDARRAAGWQLEAILPFSREVTGQLARATLDLRNAEKADPAAPLTRKQIEMARNQIDTAVSKIGMLADQAAWVLELDDWTPTSAAVSVTEDEWASRRYATIGQMLVRRADLLIALWDGRPPRGRGGTADVVCEARRNGVPVVWINSVAPTAAPVSLIPDSGGTSFPASDLVNLWRLADHKDDEAVSTGQNAAIQCAVEQVMLGHNPDRAICVAQFLREDPAEEWVARPNSGEPPLPPVPGDTFRAYARMLYLVLRYPNMTLLEPSNAEKVLAPNKGPVPLRSYPFRLARHREGNRYHETLLYDFNFGVDGKQPGTANAKPLLDHAKQADALALRLSNQYRSAYVWIFLLAPVAVTWAVLSAIFGDLKWLFYGVKLDSPFLTQLVSFLSEPKPVFVMLELGTVMLAASIFWRTSALDPVRVAKAGLQPNLWQRFLPRPQDTHQRWLDARLIAESQRSGQLLAWAGFSGRRPIAELKDPEEEDERSDHDDHGDHHSHHGVRTVWAPHYANAIATLPALPHDGLCEGQQSSTRMDPARIGQLAEAASKVIADQQRYHRFNRLRLETLNHRLDSFSLFAIKLALIISSGFLVMWWANKLLDWDPLPGWPGTVLYFLYGTIKNFAAFSGAVLPAVAAAAAGIRFQGDFERFAMRSKDTAARLKALSRRAALIKAQAEGRGAKACASKPPLFEPLLDLLLDTQAVLDEDLADWRFAYAARPITLG